MYSAVGVCRGDESRDRQPRASGHVPGEEVTERPARHRERDALPRGEPVGSDRGEIGPEIVHRLARDSTPVDAVDAPEAALLPQGLVREEFGDDGVEVVAAVGASADADGVHVGLIDGCHLPLLGVRDEPACRVEDPRVNAIAADGGVRGGRAGVSRRRHEHVASLVPPAQEVVGEGDEEPHGDVLERHRGAVKQLEDERVRRLHQRRDVRVVERGERLVQQPPQVARVDVRRLDEQREHLEREFRERQPGPRFERVGFHDGDALGDVQPAVGGETVQDDILEARVLEAARADVPHDAPRRVRAPALLSRAGGEDLARSDAVGSFSLAKDSTSAA